MLLSAVILVLLLTSVHSTTDTSHASDAQSEDGRRQLTFVPAHEYGEAEHRGRGWPFSHHPPDKDPLILFSNRPEAQAAAPLSLDGRYTSMEAPRIRTRPMRISRPRSNSEFQRARLHSMRYSESIPLEWDNVDVLGPDTEDRITLLELAKITGNAYAMDMNQTNWYPLDGKWNTVRLPA